MMTAEPLREIEEKLERVKQEYKLAVQRHEFLAQADLWEEIQQLKKQRDQLRLRQIS
ncbi:hypothetical protein [Polycladomyces subterraneus]|uniref:Uncharacterized protein n=1 Tax=Polycladomyces subterraneus TaxID=1016997 RepID=A0ABT8IR71_9BACL|nr:hypothetical protein [Polycladomyces subterraneus]MDN4595272.1 hypothetical protein [Polycladomyces subterraneus]